MIQTITLALVALSTISLTAAGPHGQHISPARRRHHSRAHRRGSFNHATPLNAAKRDCEEGAWQCTGTELQRCNYEAWIPIANCTGDNIVCSADERAVGCIWTWSLDDAQPVVATHIPVAQPLPSPSASASAQASPSTGAAESAVVTVAPSSDASASISEASPSPTDFSSASASASSEEDVPSASESLIGGNLWAGSPESTSRHHKSSSSTQDWYAAPTYGSPSPSDSFAVSSTDAWVALSTTAAWAASSSDAASASASDDWQAPTPTTTGWYQAPQLTASASASPSGGSGDSADSVDNGDPADSPDSPDSPDAPSSSSKGVSKTKTSAAASQSTGAGSSNAPSGSYSAPHYVVYSDSWLGSMPSASDLSSYNRFILAFWMSGPGAVDNAQAWAGFGADYRQQVLDEYHAAGIALMVSAFGATDSPTTDGQDPADTAQRLAAWVKQYGLDGVDIDYEDMTAMNNDQAEAWIITFQTTLRQLLPAPYLISHAPVAPWFTSNNKYPSGAYVSVHQQTGQGIDWYNVQFYNQGSGVYEDCNSLVTDSGSEWPDTSVMGINSYAKVPLDKIVIGKPLDSGAAANGFVDGSLLATCVALAKSEGWNAGVMFWEWVPSVAGVLMATVRGT